jgi:uncharacterized protein (UPF0332 family)
MNNYTNDLIKYRLQRANETLEEAKTMAETNHWNTCVNRLYYACFYAVNALLLNNNLSSAKHSGVRGLLNKHFIRTGIISKDFGKLYNSLYEYRQQCDYEDLFQMDEEIAISYINQTKQFIKSIKALIP